MFVVYGKAKAYICSVTAVVERAMVLFRWFWKDPEHRALDRSRLKREVR